MKHCSYCGFTLSHFLCVFCVSVCFASQYDVCPWKCLQVCPGYTCMCGSKDNGGRGVFYWWKFKYIQALVWVPTCQCTMSQRSFWWKGKGEEKETSGFGSKHWISFQAWTLHWVFQQMSKSLLAVDRQPNGPQHIGCGRAIEEEEEETETKDKHKWKIVYATFSFFSPCPRDPQFRTTKQILELELELAKTLLTTFHSPLWQLLWFIFPFLCSALLLRHGRNDSWIGVQP